MVICGIVGVTAEFAVAKVARSAASSACVSTAKQPMSVGYRASTGMQSGPLRLDDATDAWGADTPLTGMRAHAIATGDVNRDGWVDVFVGTFADRPVAEYQHRGAKAAAPDRLLLGGPSGFRVDDMFPGTRGRTSGAAFGDLDGDGDLDLVVARNVRASPVGSEPSVVLRNDDGRFTAATTLRDPAGARSVGLFDYDADGHLDLFVAEDRFAGGSSVLLRGHGDLSFDDVTERSGIGRDVVGMGVGTGDLDDDGRPDLFVGGSNRLFLNEGGGRFAESSAGPGAWKVYGDEDDAAGVAEGDVNGDGRPDIVVGQHYNSTLDDGRKVPVRLYLNEADGDGLVLRDVTDAAGLVGLPTKSPHVEIVDVDADGRPDIVTTAAGEDGRPVVFRNTGTGRAPVFEPTSAPGPAQYWVTGAVFDADHDGKLDIVSVEWEPSLPTRFWRNVGQVGHWLTVEAPTGSTVDVSGVGSDEGRLLASATVGAATGYSAGPADRVQFGLGARDRVRVSVARPGADPVERSARADRLLVCRR